MLESLLLAGLQFLQPMPELAEVGETVQVRAVGAEGQPLAGLVVEVEKPDGTSDNLGSTDASGLVAFTPAEAGEHRFVAELPTGGGTLRLWTPYRVVAARPRWLYALACVPLGLALLWRNLRFRRGPSPRDP